MAFMTSTNPARIATQPELQPRPANWTVAVIAIAIAVAHLLTNGRYGFHRDELQTLSDALHLDWGYVAYPPLTPFVERIAMALFGISTVGLRLFSVIAQSAAIFATGMMARELGGNRWAQVAAALATAVAPLALFEGTEFQYTTFDYLWWVLIAYFVIRLLKTEDPRWCLAIGALIGLGLLTKYTMAFYAGGIVLGLLLTKARKYTVTRWFWVGVGLAFLIFLPNLIWQFRHHLISLQFLQHIHKRDVGEGRAEGYWAGQFFLCANRYSLPLWIAGLFGFLRSSRYRMLLWMWLFPVAFFWLSKGRQYYPGAAYPMLFAMGAVTIAGWLARLPRFWPSALWTVYLLALLGWGVRASVVILPWQSSGWLKDFALRNNGDLREEIGWENLVRSVANIRDGLTAQEKQNLGVVVGNYGEGGAITILGAEYRLPPAIQLTNSGWLREYPVPPPDTLIVAGWTQQQLEEAFTQCRVAGHNGNTIGVKNEESEEHPDIYVCGPPKQGWVEFWRTHQRFG